MNTLNIFPFSRDGYHYALQPGFSPVWDVKHHDIDGGKCVVVAAPDELGRLLVTSESIADCETKMQDFIHHAFTSLDQVWMLNGLNEDGEKLLASFHDHLNITTP